MNAQRPIFLSSCFEDPKGMRFRIRDRVREMTGGSGEQAASQRPIWMAEDYPELKPESSWGEFEKVEFCLEGVRRAECFVAIVSERHGTPITMQDVGQVPTSFFEAELFEAALLGIPSFIFLLEGFEPEGKLAHLLKLLEPAFPHLDLWPLSEDEIARKIEGLIRHYQRPRWLRRALPTPRLSVMVDTQVAFRHHRYDPKCSPPPFRFLDGRIDSTVAKPDASRIDAILRRAATEQAHQVRLTLIWFAVRALMGASIHDSRGRDFLPFWERAFGLWTTSGAWYGLHGYFSMSCLAALGSLAEVRRELAMGSDPTYGLPHGPLASEYYSMAKLAGRNEDIFDLALTHIQLAIESNSGNTASQTAIRASIFLRTGRVAAALEDYERVAELRRESGGPAYGEALSEWGYAMLGTKKKTEGVRKMEEGLELLRSGPPSGFQVRAMKKLAEGYARCWKIGAAVDLITEAVGVAEAIGARDQLRTLERLARYLTKR